MSLSRANANSAFFICLSLTSVPVMAVGSFSQQPSLTPQSLMYVSELHPGHGRGGALPFRPINPEEYALAKTSANRKAGVEAKAGGKPSGGGGGGPTVSSYSNVAPSFNGNYNTGMAPPDTTGAIGPDRYIEMINTQYAIYKRDGSLVKKGSLSSLTGISTGLFGYSLSDPQVMWDVTTQRFYYMAIYFDSLFLNDNGIAVGWSKTPTPASASDFCQYILPTGTLLADYPKLGDSRDFLLMGFNGFDNAASTYTGSNVYTLNKPSAGTSCAATSQFTAYDSGTLNYSYGGATKQAATPVPANLVDNQPNDGDGGGFVAANADLTDPAFSSTGANFILVYKVTTNGSDLNGIPIPNFTSPPVQVTVTPYSIPSSAPQSGSAYLLLDTLDGRFEAAVAAVDSSQGNAMALWTAHAVYGGAGSEERWYEINPTGSGSVIQSGRVSDNNLFIWNGAVSPDRNGTTPAYGGSMAMSLSTSSANAYPAIQFVTKRAGGSQSGLKNLVQANGPNIDFSCSDTAPCRWGDYSGASPDPASLSNKASGNVWLANQYNVSSGTTSDTDWRTWVFAVTP